MWKSWLFLKRWWSEHGEKLVLLGAILLALALSFEAGILKGMARGDAPMLVEIPKAAATVGSGNDAPSDIEKENASSKTESAKTVACAFVGSRNSTLYHLPTCGTAKRIKAENRVCFVSKEDAETKGYKPGCLK